MPEEIEYNASGCQTCYRASLPECSATIKVKAGLTASTSYSYLVLDKFDNPYRKDIMTDVDGNFTITVADFPKGLFTRHSGVFELKVYKADKTPAVLTINAANYPCINMEFTNEQKTAVIPEI